MFSQYFETYERLSGRINARPETDPETTQLKESIARTDETFSGWWAVELAASRVRASDPDEADAIYQEGLAQFPTQPELANNYGNFLKNVRKDYDRAGQFYQRAVATDPNAADYLGNYALLLFENFDNGDRAEEYFRRALDADPNYANNLGNLAGFLLARGKKESGLEFLNRAIEVNEDREPDALVAECWFYAFVHGPMEKRSEALHHLKASLVAGARSPDWDLSGNIEWARRDGHPDMVWLEKLAAVISGGADLSILDDWHAWREA